MIFYAGIGRTVFDDDYLISDKNKIVSVHISMLSVRVG